jgi:DNA-binding PadR family transcriptional regulator
MHEDGWLTMRTNGDKTLGPARRYYTVTAKGRKELSALIETAKTKGLL